MKKPDDAVAKAKMHFATVWLGENEDGELKVMGVNWLHEYILLRLSVFYHNHIFARFMPALGYPSCGFPFEIIEKYDPNFEL